VDRLQLRLEGREEQPAEREEQQQRDGPRADGAQQLRQEVAGLHDLATPLLVDSRLDQFQEHHGTGFAGPSVLPPARGLAKRHEVREDWGCAT